MLRHLIAASLTSVAFYTGYLRAKWCQAWRGWTLELALLGNSSAWALLSAAAFAYAHNEVCDAAHGPLLWRLVAMYVLLELLVLVGRLSSLMKRRFVVGAWLLTVVMATEWFIVLLK